MLGHKGSPGDHPIQLEQAHKWERHHTFIQNLNAMSLYVILLIKCSTSIFLSDVRHITQTCTHQLVVFWNYGKRFSMFWNYASQERNLNSRISLQQLKSIVKPIISLRLHNPWIIIIRVCDMLIYDCGWHCFHKSDTTIWKGMLNLLLLLD